MSWLVKVVGRLLWVYSFITLAFILSVSAFPGVLLIRWVLQSDSFWGWTPNPVLHLFFVTFSVALSYFIMGLTMMLVLPVLSRILARGLKPGRIPIRSFAVWNWYNVNGMILTFQTLFGKFWRSSSIYVLFLRAMGAKIGNNVIVNSNVVYDCEFLEIGDNTVIGGDAAIIGHVGEKGHLVLEPIKIGKDCTIGQYTTVFPGATIGDNCHVGAMSLVPKGAKLDSNSVYGGVPVKKIKDLKPGDHSRAKLESEPEALAIEFQR